MSIVERLSRHFDTLSPHIKERKTAALLNEAREELVRLQTENAMFKSALMEIAGQINSDHSMYDNAERAYRIAQEALTIK